MARSLSDVEFDNVVSRLDQKYTGLNVPAVWISETVFDGGVASLVPFGFKRLGLARQELAVSSALLVDLQEERTLRLLPRELATPGAYDPLALFEGTFSDSLPAWFNAVHDAGHLAVFTTPRPIARYADPVDFLDHATVGIFPLAVFGYSTGPGTRRP